MSTATLPNRQMTQTQQVAEIATQRPKPGLIATMAAKHNLEPAKYWNAIKSTVFSNKGTDEEMIAFLVVCDHYGLNPFLREIYAFPKKGGGIQPIVSVDGWAKVINRNPELNGINFQMEFADNGKPFAATCTLYRKDREHPTVLTEYYSECYRTTDPWNQMPCRMLRHKSMIQCARMAFGLAGIVDQDEAEQMAANGVLVMEHSSTAQSPITLNSLTNPRLAETTKPESGFSTDSTDDRRQETPNEQEPDEKPTVAAEFMSRIEGAMNETALKTIEADAKATLDAKAITQFEYDQIGVMLTEARQRK